MLEVLLITRIIILTTFIQMMYCVPSSIDSIGLSRLVKLDIIP